MIKSIVELTEKNLVGKKILLRVDFNVPVENGRISETYRIKSSSETIDFLVSRGAIVGLVSHITAVDSFKSIAGQIKKILKRNIIFLNDCIGQEVVNKLNDSKPGTIFLLDNVRKYAGEEKNDYNFAKKLAKAFDIYVNNAFSVSHREHASIAAITAILPSYAGLLLIKEIDNLTKVIGMPKKNKTLVLGGAKVDTKFPVIRNFLNKAEHILIGGVVANVFLKASGVVIGESLTDDNFLTEAKNLIDSDANIIIPRDYVESECMILDIGGKTVEQFSKIIKKSKIVVWNGPVGKSEIKKFSEGTKKISKSIIDSEAFSVVGGGDTIAFIEKNNLIDKFDYVSTGGGAMLEFLAGNKLPGLKALNYYGA